MGFNTWFSSRKDKKLSVKATSTNPYSDSNFFGRIFGKKTNAGIDVNYSSAMQHNDVYSCVRIKAESLGQLPVRLYRSELNKRTEILAGREYDIFTKRPNQFQTWQGLIEQYVTSLELVGHFAAEIKRNRFGNVYAIVPFKYQNNVRTEMDDEGQVYYTYATNDGKGKVTTQTYAPNDVLYINAFTFDGYTGISTITQCALAVGTAIAAEEHAAAMFENGANPMGVLSTEQAFGDDEEAVQRLRQQWNELHKGSKNSGKTAILEYGLKFTPITMSAVDVQLLEQRKFSREQIASMFRVPLHLLQASTGMKYANVEQNNIAFFRDALIPLAQKLENHVNQILPANHTIKLDERAFVRGDRQALVETISSEIKSGLCSINEGRADLGRDPVEGGDKFAVDTNNLTFGTWEELPSFVEQQAAKNPKPAGGSETPKKTEQPAKGT